jgi:hypothetical protein
MVQVQKYRERLLPAMQRAGDTGTDVVSATVQRRLEAHIASESGKTPRSTNLARTQPAPTRRGAGRSVNPPPASQRTSAGTTNTKSHPPPLPPRRYRHQPPWIPANQHPPPPTHPHHGMRNIRTQGAPRPGPHHETTSQSAVARAARTGGAAQTLRSSSVLPLIVRDRTKTALCVAQHRAWPQQSPTSSPATST